MSGPVELGGEEAHVWTTDPNAGMIQREPARYLEWLSAEERERYGRFRFEKDRRLFLAGQAQIRAVLSLYDEEIGAAQWRFSTNPYGRPEIANPHRGAALRFNLSHTQGAVVSAVVRTRAIGIDVESLDRDVDMLGIARSSFAPGEFRELAALSGEERRNRFFEYWTLKEAYIKARGKGLSIPLNQFWFKRCGGKIAVQSEGADSAEEWQFEQFRPTPRHRAAVAVQVRAGEELRLIIRPFAL